MMKKNKIGITINISSPSESFFANGAKQHAVNLRNLFLQCKNVEEVYFINLGSQKDLSNSPWLVFQDKIITLQECVNKVNLIVTLMSGLSPETNYQLKKLNIKVVKQAVGTEYHMFAEHMLFGNGVSNFDGRSKYDTVWILPHHFNSNKDYFEVLCDCQGYESPFIWSPQFLETEMKINGEDKYLYKNKGKEKRISVLEPNINLVKHCLTPMLAGEKLYRNKNKNFKKISIFCSQKISKNPELIKFVNSLDVYKNKKMFFENRYHILHTLINHTDIVLSHQRDLELNYAYFDVAWLGYPLVHNSKAIKDLGYYYHQFNADQAADNIVQVINTFDQQSDQYLKKSREIIAKFLPSNKDNVTKYEDLIENVML